MKANLVKKFAVVTVLAAAAMAIATGCGSKDKKEESKQETLVQEEKKEEAPAEETAEEGALEEAAPEETAEAEVELAEDFMPGCFLDERTGKDTYESYDEIVAALTGEEAYAMVQLMGYDGDILLVTEGTWDNLDGNNAAMDANIYMPNANGKITYANCLTSAGTAYPISVKDGVLYAAGGHFVESNVVSQETGAVMVKDYVYEDFDTTGKASYTGFVRETNSFDEKAETEITDENGEKALADLFDQFNSAEVVNFTAAGK